MSLGEKQKHIKEQETEANNGGLEASRTTDTQQVKLAPLTVGLCLAVFLLSVDRTIVAIVS